MQSLYSVTRDAIRVQADRSVRGNTRDRYIVKDHNKTFRSTLLPTIGDIVIAIVTSDAKLIYYKPLSSELARG